MRVKLPMFYINIFMAAGASNVVKIEKIRFIDYDIGFFVFKDGVAVGTNDFPRLYLVMVVFNYFHKSSYFLLYYIISDHRAKV